MKNKYVSKRRINLKILIMLLLITTAIASALSMSKFETTITSSNKTIVAVPMIDSSTTLKLDDNILYPNMEKPIEYSLVVKNAKDNKVNQVSLKYTIKIESLGNIPLDIAVYREDDTNNETNLLTNGKTSEIDMPIDEAIHNYKLIIKWDNTLEGYNNYLYNGEVSYVKIDIDAVQVD